MSTLPYGSWPSPITAAQVVAAGSTPTGVWAEGDTTWWSETRPAEGGREQIVRLDPDGTTSDVMPPGFDVRTRVHEYGGGAWWVHDGTVFAVHAVDQRLYRVGAPTPADPAPAAVPITPEPPAPQSLRYADGVVTADGRWVVCVRERHEGPDPATDVHNELVAVPTDGSAAPHLLLPDDAAPHDFVASPRISRDGRQLAWITWDHPDMPWDAAALWLGRLAEVDGRLRVLDARREAGQPGESLMTPAWGRHGRLYVISDRSGWWNVHRVDGVDHLEPLDPRASEVGWPMWRLGGGCLAVTSDGTLVAATTTPEGAALLLEIDDPGPTATHSDNDSATVRERPIDGRTGVRTLCCAGNRVVALVDNATRGPEIVAVRLDGTSSG
jgi:hypothetical protein